MAENPNILIIEDEEVFRNPLVRILQMQGYNVFGASSGSEALSLTANNNFDLIVTDVRLPEKMDGLDILKRIKESRPDYKSCSIVMTGYAGDDAPIRAIRVGADDFLYKPFELEQFLYSVRKNLHLHALEKQREAHMAQIETMRKQLQDYSSQLETKVKEKTHALSFIFAIGKEITSSLKVDEVLHLIVDRTSEVLRVDTCAISLLDPVQGCISVAASHGLSEEFIVSFKVSLSDPLLSWVLERREALFINNINSDERFRASQYTKFGGSFICVPLIFKNKPIGVINIGRNKGCDPLSSDDLIFIKSIADHASISIANAQLYTDLKDVYLQVIETLNSIIEIKDSYTKGHCERVTKYAIMIAKKMFLSEADTETLRLACQLHDLGKIGIHDHILTKQGKLTPDEWEEMRLHPAKGVEILRPLGFLNEVMTLVEQHHEWFNGKGYPRGLAGEKIDLRARIMAVADSFDAMTTKRPYSPALTLEEAVAELKRCAGSQFDSNIVAFFVDIIDNTPDILSC